MAEAVGSCTPFSGDERSLFATLSGVVAIFMIYLAQAADLMNGSLLAQLLGIRISYFVKILTAIMVPGLGVMAAFSSNVNTWKTSWRLKRKKFWQGELLKSRKGSSDKELYWDPRSLKVLMVADIWIGYSGEEDWIFGNAESVRSCCILMEVMSIVFEFIRNRIRPHLSELKIILKTGKFDINKVIDPPPSPPTATTPSKTKRLQDLEATHPLQIQGKEMLCYKHSPLSMKDGGTSHAPGGTGSVNEQEEHIVPMPECSTNNNDDSTEPPPVLDRVMFLRERAQKQALLHLGFVPDYEELSYLRTNTSWGMMLLGLQSLGYIVSGMIRIFEDRIMSPIEVVAMFFSCVSLLQVLFQMFGSISTQRPVLITLTPAEFSSFQQQVKHIEEAEKHKEEKEPLSLRALYIVGFLIAIICTSWLPSSMLFRYGSYFKKAAHHSRVCYASAVCFAVILLVPPFRHLQFWNMWILSPWLSLATLALATAGTIKEWKNLCFNEPSAEWYSLLIPHVGNF